MEPLDDYERSYLRGLLHKQIAFNFIGASRVVSDETIRVTKSIFKKLDLDDEAEKG